MIDLSGTTEPEISLAIHPGDWFRTAIVEPYGVDLAFLAEYLSLDREGLGLLLYGKRPMDHMMAVRLEQEFEVSSEWLLRLQESFDLAHGRVQVAAVQPATIPWDQVDKLLGPPDDA